MVELMSYVPLYTKQFILERFSPAGLVPVLR